MDPLSADSVDDSLDTELYPGVTLDDWIKSLDDLAAQGYDGDDGRLVPPQPPPLHDTTELLTSVHSNANTQQHRAPFDSDARATSVPFGAAPDYPTPSIPPIPPGVFHTPLLSPPAVGSPPAIHLSPPGTFCASLPDDGLPRWMPADPHSPFIKWPPDSSVPMPPLQLGPTAEANARGYQPSVYGGSHAASPGSVPGLTPSNTVESSKTPTNMAGPSTPASTYALCTSPSSTMPHRSAPPGFSPSAYFSPSLYPAEPSPSVPEDMPVLVTRVDGLRYGFKEDPDGVKWFHCLHPGCNERYKNRVGNLKDHQRRIHDPTFEPFRCTQCSATYSRPNALKNHKSKMHGHLLDSNPPIPASVNNSR